MRVFVRIPVEKVLLCEAIEILGSAIIGERLQREFGGWPMYSKFFDNKGALPFHIHHRDEHANLINQPGKPEAYYFPVQLNNYGADYPYTFLGLKPGTTKDAQPRMHAASPNALPRSGLVQPALNAINIVPFRNRVGHSQPTKPA